MRKGRVERAWGGTIHFLSRNIRMGLTHRESKRILPEISKDLQRTAGRFLTAGSIRFRHSEPLKSGTLMIKTGKEGNRYGKWNREMVQRQQGFWVH